MNEEEMGKCVYKIGDDFRNSYYSDLNGYETFIRHFLNKLTTFNSNYPKVLQGIHYKDYCLFLKLLKGVHIYNMKFEVNKDYAESINSAQILKRPDFIEHNSVNAHKRFAIMSNEYEAEIANFLEA